MLITKWPLAWQTSKKGCLKGFLDFKSVLFDYKNAAMLTWKSLYSFENLKIYTVCGRLVHKKIFDKKNPFSIFHMQVKIGKLIIPLTMTGMQSLTFPISVANYTYSFQLQNPNLKNVHTVSTVQYCLKIGQFLG